MYHTKRAVRPGNRHRSTPLATWNHSLRSELTTPDGSLTIGDCIQDRPGAFSADTSPRPTETGKCSLTAQSRSGGGPACIKAVGPPHRRTKWSASYPRSTKEWFDQGLTCGQNLFTKSG